MLNLKKILLGLLTNSLKANYLAPNNASSNLEYQIESIGVQLSLDRLDQSESTQRLFRSFRRCLDNDQAERSLKKGFNITYENCLRTLALRIEDPSVIGLDKFGVSTLDHPLDGYALADIERYMGHRENANPGPQNTSRLRYLVYGVGLGMAFFIRALKIALVRGSRQVVPLEAIIATPNYWGVDRFKPFIDAAKRIGQWHGRAMLIVQERPGNQDILSLVDYSVAATSFRVPLGDWFRRVGLPGTRFALAAMVPLLRPKKDLIACAVAIEGLEQLNQSLQIWRTAFNVRSRYYVDREEHAQSHILKQIIFSKFGLKLMRWPGSHFESLGRIASHLSYDVFFSGGNYEACNLRKTWRPELEVVQIGNVQLDKGMNSPTRMALRYETQLTEAIKSGKKIAAFFGTGELPGHNSCMLESLFVMCNEVVNHQDWLLVIKPKKGGERDDLEKLTQEDSRFQQFRDEPRIVWLKYRADEAEVCPSGWLVEKMIFGAGNRHTIFAEALANGKPYFTYYPIKPITKFRLCAERDGFYISDMDGFSAAIRNGFENADGQTRPSEYYKKSFDPFGDDRAFERMAGYIFSASRQQSSDIASASELTKI